MFSVGLYYCTIVLFVFFSCMSGMLLKGSQNNTTYLNLTIYLIDCVCSIDPMLKE